MLGRKSCWSWNDFHGEQGDPTLGSFGVSHASRSAFTDVSETDRKILPRKRDSPAPRMHASITEKPLMYFVIYLDPSDKHVTVTSVGDSTGLVKRAPAFRERQN